MHRFSFFYACNCVCWVYLSVFNQNVVLVGEYHVDCWQTLQWRFLWWILGAENWSQKETGKRTVTQNILFAISMVQKLAILNAESIKICGWIKRLKLLFVCIFPCLLNIYRKFECLIFQCSVAAYLRWDGYCRIDFVANFVRFPAVLNFWQSVKFWQGYREFKGGNFWDTV